MLQPALVTSGPGVSLDAVGRAAASLDEEERELWRQLRRKRDFEGRVTEKLSQLAELRDRRRTVSNALSEAASSVEHLTGELAFVRQQERDLEHDIAVLKESNRILQNAFQSQQPQLPPGKAAQEARLEPRDALAEERARRESVQAQHEQISNLRSQLERLRAEKAALQQRQQALFDRQRSAEQDRNRLIGSLQDDRSGINELRAERIRLWEERASMEREVARIMQEVQLDIGEGSVEAARQPALPGTSGGVRGRVSQDTPLAFAGGGQEAAASPLWEEDAAGAVPVADAPPARRHWTSFSEGAEGDAGKASSPVFGGLSGPPSFGSLGGGPSVGASPGGPGPVGGAGDVFGVTEWSGTVRDFKASAGVKNTDRFL
mmetsp:Transcript_109151/g.336971  ORF Transcript_109151/g.336971 Transcript_109151/m.336971 type:complete len:376 (-) Transcript_109151:18-1145(-)